MPNSSTLNANDHSEYTVNSRPIEAIGAIKNENIGNWYNNKNRVYSEWYHIEDEKLTQPINQIRATLNANDHSEYSVNSRPIEAIGAIKNENISNWYNNKK